MLKDIIQKHRLEKLGVSNLPTVSAYAINEYRNTVRNKMEKSHEYIVSHLQRNYIVGELKSSGNKYIKKQYCYLSIFLDKEKNEISHIENFKGLSGVNIEATYNKKFRKNVNKALHIRDGN